MPKTSKSDPAPTTNTVTSTEDASNGQRHKLSMYIVIIVAIVVVAVVVKIITSSVYGIKLKPLTYNNGQGYKFSLKFYNKYYRSKDYTSTKAYSPSASGQNGLAIALASKSSLNGQFPLWLSITESPLDSITRDTYTEWRTIPCTPSPTAFVIKARLLKQKISICKSTIITDRPAYNATFIYNQKLYYLLITQVATKDQVIQATNKTSLADYRTDISTIINSIKPLQ